MFDIALCSITILSCLFPLYQVIPGLSSELRESSEKPSDLFAYVSVIVLKEQLGGSCALWWQIRKCNLTKCTLVGGVTLAEVCKIVCHAFSFYREEKVSVDCYFCSKYNNFLPSVILHKWRLGRVMCTQPYPYLVKVERLFLIDPWLKESISKDGSM